MERKFKIYQRRDGFQIAEEATGIRLDNGMEFLARPNKSVNWCTADFNIVIDDDYELVGEEVIDCSIEPVLVICFIDGVMKTYNSKKLDDAHAEALEMDIDYQKAISTIADNLTLPVWDGCSETIKREVVKEHHAEALKLNSLFNIF